MDEPSWRLIREECRPGPVTMALEEVAAETAAAGGPATVRVYRWPDVLSLGYGQDPETIDWEFCEREGIGVTRRRTGGGAIYHDRTGDVSYGIVAPADAVEGSLLDVYHAFCEPILDALADVGVNAGFVDGERDGVHDPTCYLRALHPAHDVVGPDGRKLSGNAQHRSGDAVVQHGSVSYSLRPERHVGCFTESLDPDAFRERVGAIDECVDVPRERVVSAVESSLADWADAEAGEWRDDELERARELAAEKYGDATWTRAGPRA